MSIELEIADGFYTRKMGLNDLGNAFPRCCVDRNQPKEEKKGERKLTYFEKVRENELSQT